MKLPNFLDWATLNNLRGQMGAPLAEKFGPQLKVKSIDLPIAEQLQTRGIDVEFDEIRILDDGTLGYKGHRVLLYIRDISNYSNRDKQSMPKFHFTFCSTLNTMRQNRRFARYVVANRADGEFQVNLIGQTDEPRFVRLHVCQNCLAQIAWQGFSSELTREARSEAVKNFSLPAFFEKYPRDLLAVKPDHTSETAPLNDYPPNWSEISDRARLVAAYRCCSCSIRLPGADSKFLHVHHRNGQKNDCHPDNLEVLCIRCHADEPMHGHMKAMPLYHEFLAKYGAR
jgi:hypothetical protein